MGGDRHSPSRRYHRASVHQGDGVHAAKQYVSRIAELAPLSLCSVKQITGELMKDEADRDDDFCFKSYMQCYTSADYAEGRRAFMGKRKPNFVGR